MSQFLLQYLDGRVRIWHLQHESINPSCLVSTVQATTAGVTWLALLKCHRLSVVADHVPPFMAKMYPSTNGYFQQDNASTVTRSLSNRVTLACGGTQNSHPGCTADKSPATEWYHVNMDQNLYFQHLIESIPWRIEAILKAEGFQTGTNKSYIIKCTSAS